MTEDNWSQLHGGVEVKGFIKYWIVVSKFLAAPFILLRITPNWISFLTILISIPFIFNPNAWWLVLIGLILDGIDGRVAIETKRTSKFGAIVDSVSDRIVEFIWAIGLYSLGLNPIVVFFFIGLAWTQEYLRARAGGLGFKDIGIVTVGERPVRAIFIILISLITPFSKIILLIALINSIVSLTTLTFVVRRKINQ